MSLLSATLEPLLLVATFAGFSAWTYKYIFNHDIIVNAHSRRVSKADFNSVTARLGYRLLQLDTEGEPDLKVSAPYASGPNSAPYNSGMEPPGDPVQVVVGLVFSLGVALSLELILVLMIQLFGNVQIGVNMIKAIIKLLVVLASTVNPLMVIYLAVNQRFSRAQGRPADISRGLVMLAAGVLWYLALSRFGGIARSLEEPSGKRTLLERKTNEIALLGISITAVLSGIGSALTPLRTFWTDGDKLAAAVGRGVSRGGVSEADVNEGIQSYNSTRMILNKRREELRRCQDSASQPIRSRNLLLRVRSLARFGPHSAQDLGRSDTGELEREIVSLELLSEAIYSDLCAKLDLLRLAHNRSRSPRLDAVKMLFDVVFSVYCIYRLLNVLVLRLPYHYWKDPSTPLPSNDSDADTLNNITKDALAITIAKIIQACFGYLPLSETQLINQVGFILSGLLFLCSFQNVLVTFTSVGRLLPASEMAETTKSWLKNLVLSELLAIYVLAAALLMRLNLPSESAELILHIMSLTSASGTFREMMREVQFIDAWFDKVFAMSGVLSLLILGLKSYIDSDALDGYDEEAMVEGKLS